MTQARAILWAQWRAARASYLKSGITWSVVVGLLWYGFWFMGAFIASRIMADPDRADIATALPGGLLIIFLYWQLVPLLVAAAGSSLELRKLQAYPIPVHHLFVVELLLRITSGFEMLLVVAGMGVGVLLNPALPFWAAFAAIPYILFNLLVALGLRDIVVRLMARRRVREIATIVLVALAAVPQFALRRGQGFGFIRTVLNSGAWPGWPWTATANLFHGEFVISSLIILMGWCVFMGMFAVWQFQRSLSFDTQAAQAGSGQGGSSILDPLYRLPSALFGDPLAVLVEKEIRYLARSPRFRLVFLMGCTFGLIVARAFGSESGPGSFRPDYLTGASVYSLLLLGEVCFWNTFGFDRSAAQIYFLAPIPFHRVLIAKNIAALLFVSLEILIAALLSALMRLPVSAQQIFDAFAVTAVVCVFLMAAGNIVSVKAARAVNPQSSLKGSSPGRTQAFLLFLYPATFLPAGLAYLARWAFDSNVAFFGVLAIVAAIGFLFYRLALTSASEWAQAGREEMIAVLSQGEGPIAG